MKFNATIDKIVYTGKEETSNHLELKVIVPEQRQLNKSDLMENFFKKNVEFTLVDMQLRLELDKKKKMEADNKKKKKK